jgi:hypothetical protein
VSEIVVSAKLERFLSPADAARALRCLRRVARHDISQWALTGGFAIEIHYLICGRDASMRNLNDVDFIVDSFEQIPQSLANDSLFRHVHPFDPPGKTLVQAIDPDTSLRVDVFSAFGETMMRAGYLDFPSGRFRLISLEDLVARTARLALDLARGVSTPAKHAVDFLRLVELVKPSEVETAWRDQRKPFHPTTFKEAADLLRQIIPLCRDLLIKPDYSRDVKPMCGRCAPAGAFRLVDPNVMLSQLGYC